MAKQKNFEPIEAISRGDMNLKGKLKLDDRDDIIIQMLQKNPQTSQEEIAKTLKLSQPSVWARIRNLKEKGTYIPGFLVYTPFLDECVHISGLHSNFPYGDCGGCLGVYTTEDEEYNAARAEVDPSYPVIDKEEYGGPLKMVDGKTAVEILAEIESSSDSGYRKDNFRILKEYTEMMVNYIGSDKEPCFVVFYFV